MTARCTTTVFAFGFSTHRCALPAGHTERHGCYECRGHACPLGEVK